MPKEFKAAIKVMRNPDRRKLLEKLVNADKRVKKAEMRLKREQELDKDWRKKYPDKSKYLKTIFGPEGSYKVKLQHYDRKKGEHVEDYGEEDIPSSWAYAKEPEEHDQSKTVNHLMAVRRKVRQEVFNQGLKYHANMSII